MFIGISEAELMGRTTGPPLNYISCRRMATGTKIPLSRASLSASLVGGDGLALRAPGADS